MLIDILFIVLIFSCGYALGEIVAVYRVHKFIMKVSKDAGIDLEKEIEKEVSLISRLSTEIINDTIYLYNRDDGTFVCQGKSIEELAKLTLEIKKINKAVVLHDKSIFIFDNGIVHKQ